MKKKSKFSYNGTVGRWWLHHSADAAHQRAYRKIADFIRDSYVREPGTIVDYACGPGDLLALLSRRFRQSKLVGLDGSSSMLLEALHRISRLPEECSRRISLIRTPLPNYAVLRGRADLAVFCFPNMVPFAAKAGSLANRMRLSQRDRNVAEGLAMASGESSGEIPGSNQMGLEQGRCISWNLRRLLVPGGICVRVEYATMQRHELSSLELSHVAFEEGSLDYAVNGKMPAQWFRLVASAYFRSRVLEDVYEQTGDVRDRKGGYLITVLRAI